MMNSERRRSVLCRLYPRFVLQNVRDYCTLSRCRAIVGQSQGVNFPQTTVLANTTHLSSSLEGPHSAATLAVLRTMAQPSTTEPIAIIASACRLPGSTNTPSKLWELLRHPVDLLSEIPLSRFNANGFYHENPEHHRVSSLRVLPQARGSSSAAESLTGFFTGSQREAGLLPEQRPQTVR